MPQKQTKEEFIKKAKNIFGDIYDYSKVNYINARTKVIIICKKHGQFNLKPAFHLSYKRGCPICNNVKYDINEILKKANKIHKNKYDYSKVNFTGVKNKVSIICPNHGEFKQCLDKHINAKQGCRKCSFKITDLKSFIKEAKLLHGDEYDYSQSIYLKTSENIKIICKKHGLFLQTPNNHINGNQKCPKCSRENTRVSINNFLKRCADSHNNKYDYSKVNYINSITKIEIICKRHGSFKQKPLAHANGSGCIWCTGKASHKEKLWLDQLNISIENRNIVLYGNDKKYIVDAYVPETNTVYEFNGDYWHGNLDLYNPEHINKHNKIKFKDLYDKTIKRENELISLGYNIIKIWENDFNKLIDKQKKERGRY